MSSTTNDLTPDSELDCDVSSYMNETNVSAKQLKHKSDKGTYEIKASTNEIKASTNEIKASTNETSASTDDSELIINQTLDDMKQELNSMLDNQIDTAYGNAMQIGDLGGTRKLLDDYCEKSTFRPRTEPLPIGHTLYWYLSIIGVYVLCTYFGRIG